MGVAIHVDNVTKMYGKNVVIQGLSAEIKPGEFFTLLGPSGCGKTTILRMLIGIEPPSGGRILKAGADITRTPPRERNIGIVFQNYSLFPNMDVYHNIAYALQARKEGKQEIDRR